jgi:hypothetical protein
MPLGHGMCERMLSQLVYQKDQVVWRELTTVSINEVLLELDSHFFALLWNRDQHTTT